ncbi:MAG: hypothetical protein Q4C13_08675, partial [Clostridia bacterium]|nr:hypothetical protein [Clostridia bacterium]
MLEQPRLYATPEQVQALVVKTYKETGRMLSFPAALRRLDRQGALSSQSLDYPPFLENMSPAEFDAFVLKVPFDATQIMSHDHSASRTASLIKEEGMFPFEKDVFCFKHMPYMDETPHFHDYFEITYIYSGSCRLLFNGESFAL